MRIERGVLTGLAALVLAALMVPAIWRRGDQELVVYTALDAEFAAPIFEQFTARTGITVHTKYDTESTKTVGLANAILAEKSRPRADLFWNNEILHTLRLERAGCSEAHRSVETEAFPPGTQGLDGAWHGFAARARVILVHREKVKEAEWPRRVSELSEPRWRGRCGLAKPLFGTTATHMACLHSAWGEERFESFWESLRHNDVRVLAGNRHVARAVASGQLAWGLTDTDDAVVELRAGAPVAIVYPDQSTGDWGTLFIPNTLALVRGGRNTQGARRLIDYLLSAEVESRLAAGASAQIPLRPGLEPPEVLGDLSAVRRWNVDWERAADAWPAALAILERQLLRP